MPSAETGAALCNRCKTNEALHTMRNETVCSPCFKSFISLKAVKRLEQLQRDTRTGGSGSGSGGQGGSSGPPRTQRYLLALSPGGVSSTALLSALWENQRQQRERGQKVRFELLVAVVDTELRGGGGGDDDETTSAAAAAAANDEAAFFARYAERFPGTQFRRVALEDALGLDTVDWTALPSVDTSLASPARRLADLLSRLPSTTSRADVVRLLIRHLLVQTAVQASCGVVLMGYNTTSLAELTLSETAKGRGFAVPWGVNDGWVNLPRVKRLPPRAETAEGEDSATKEEEDKGEIDASVKMLIYHPLRELFRKELLIYSGLTSPPLTPLLIENGNRSAAVVSHKDLSIDDVMARYFAEVEENYPSVVANVVRTTGKLNRAGNVENGSCGLCGLGLDEVGDERWRGELGEQKNESDGRGRLCYGCERSVYG
ncbi:hypothetical protein PFICI_04912 [Pestalotiopsis fici W106-1]|uniref:Cytoplasmic tRNA 2-thiolation protein 2 n=1 Tax=Pestalotiopsis fici (strain W106-1 / CGMCC3.15140) TaxID=1229662 RepID=W3XCX7_PESFW|nr:uncharacterized protein PFICI_04912 [Pestalotiopsis fici W106-1]ETS83036.1 hypothetical protein PFICI_04912 [Pestalotiopsis fici W106-1]